MEAPGGQESAVGLAQFVKDDQHGVEVAMTVTKTWASGPTSFYQMDIVVKNTGSFGLADAVISWPASCQDQVTTLVVSF